MDKVVYYQGNSLSYTVEETHKPICICLHGMNMSKEMFDVKPLRNLLSQYSLIQVDLCGYGNSLLDKDTFNMEVFDTLLLELMKQEQIDNCYICGYCLGGIFALDFTIRHPSLIKHFIMIETMIYLPKWLWLCACPGYQTGYYVFQKQTWLLKILECFPMFTNISHPQRIAISQSRWNKEVNTFYLKLMREYEKINHIERCKTVNCSIDIIYSQTSFHNVKKTAKDLSIYDFVTIHECQCLGHFLFLDNSLAKLNLSHN
ncbi:MAG: alpha/beta hydrolase [Coprobacillus sp.]